MSDVSGEYLASLFAKLDQIPIWEIMREDERKRGNSVIVPGDMPWLPADDWDSTVVVSQRGKEVRLIALLAKHPGAGAFHRMVGKIRSSGLTPVIIAPSREMAATMRRWGWYRRYVGSGFTQEEQWRPRKAVA